MTIWKEKVHHLYNKSQLLDPTVNQQNPVHSTT